MARDRSKDRAQCAHLGAGSGNILLETLFALGEPIAITAPSMSVCLSSVLVCGSPLLHCLCFISKSSITFKVNTWP